MRIFSAKFERTSRVVTDAALAATNLRMARAFPWEADAKGREFSRPLLSQSRGKASWIFSSIYNVSGAPKGRSAPFVHFFQENFGRPAPHVYEEEQGRAERNETKVMVSRHKTRLGQREDNRYLRFRFSRHSTCGR